jgi:hypothetical protein
MSNESFKIGDLVVTQNAIYFSEYDGTPAIIVGECAGRSAVNMNTMKEEWHPFTYEVRLLLCDQVVTVRPYQIRKPGDTEKSIESNEELINNPLP